MQIHWNSKACTNAVSWDISSNEMSCYRYFRTITWNWKWLQIYLSNKWFFHQMGKWCRNSWPNGYDSCKCACRRCNLQVWCLWLCSLGPGLPVWENVVHKMSKPLGVKKIRTMPYHTESEGMVECYNKALAKLSSALVNEEPTDLYQLWSYVMMAYQFSLVTRYFSSFLLFCREHVKTYRLLAKTPCKKANTSDV